MSRLLPLFLALLTPLAAVAESAIDVSERLTVHAPLVHGGLALFPVTDRRADAAPAGHLSLGHALERGVAKVSEASEDGSVPTLTIQNTGTDPVFAMAGDVVIGGKQDRVLTEDVVLAPGQTQDVSVNCVEQGRWNGGSLGHDFAYGGKAEVELQRVVRGQQDQGATWAGVAKLNADKTKALKARGVETEVAPSTGTYRASLQQGDVARLVDEGLKALLPGLDREGTVGVVVAVDGKVASFEVYRAAATWKRDRDHVVRSHVLQALSSGAEASAAPTVSEAAAVLKDALTATVVEETTKESAKRTTKQGARTKVYELADGEEGLKTLGYVE